MRRWNTDPIEYAWQSTYVCFNNNPIYYSDPLGLEGDGPGDETSTEEEQSTIPHGRPDSDHRPTLYKTSDGTIVQYTQGGLTVDSWELNSVPITTETAKVAELNYNLSPEGMSEYHTREAQKYLGQIFTTEDGCSKYLSHSMLALFGGQTQLQTVEDKVVSGGEGVAKAVGESHPGVIVYNLGSYYGGGNNIYGEEQGFVSAHLGLLAFIPGEGWVDDAAKPLIKVVSSGDEIYDAAKAARGLWSLTEEGASAIKRHSQFGKIFKSKSDGLWWAIDNAGHGGSKFKVFKETPQGLEWFRDADEFGDFILNKHKGSTGKFIPWGQLKTIK